MPTLLDRFLKPEPNMVPAHEYSWTEIQALRKSFLGQRLASRKSRIQAFAPLRRDVISRQDAIDASFDQYSPSESLLFSAPAIHVSSGGGFMPVDEAVNTLRHATPPEQAAMPALMFDNFGVPFHAGEFTTGQATRRYIPTGLMRFIVEYAAIAQSISEILDFGDPGQSVQSFLNDNRTFTFTYSGFSIAPIKPNPDESVGDYLKRGGFILNREILDGKKPLAVYTGWYYDGQVARYHAQDHRRTHVCYLWGKAPNGYPVCEKGIAISQDGQDQGIVTTVKFNRDGTITQNLKLLDFDKGWTDTVGDWFSKIGDEFVNLMCKGQNTRQEVDALGAQISVDTDAQTRGAIEGAAGDALAAAALKYGGLYGAVGAGIYTSLQLGMQLFGACDPDVSTKISQTGLPAKVDSATGVINYVQAERNARMVAIRQSISSGLGPRSTFAPLNPKEYPTPRGLTKLQLAAAAGAGFLLMAILTRRSANARRKG